MKLSDMRFKLATYSLFVTILLWGTLLGGIVYSHLVYFPVYLSALPDSAVVITGTYGIHDARFWLTIHPLLILSFIVTLVLNWKYKQRRKLISITFAVYLVVLIITRLYFVPELIAFEGSAQSNVSRAEWLARTQLWQRMSWVRGAVCYAATLPLLYALTIRVGLAERE